MLMAMQHRVVLQKTNTRPACNFELASLINLLSDCRSLSFGVLSCFWSAAASLIGFPELQSLVGCHAQLENFRDTSYLLQSIALCTLIQLPRLYVRTALEMRLTCSSQA